MITDEARPIARLHLPGTLAPAIPHNKNERKSYDQPKNQVAR
jgi:hypothetical protein